MQGFRLLLLLGHLKLRLIDDVFEIVSHTHIRLDVVVQVLCLVLEPLANCFLSLSSVGADATEIFHVPIFGD